MLFNQKHNKKSLVFRNSAEIIFVFYTGSKHFMICSHVISFIKNSLQNVLGNIPLCKRIWQNKRKNVVELIERGIVEV